MTTTELLEKFITGIIEDAICEGAHEWDAFAVPVTREPAEKAMRRIMVLVTAAQDGVMP
jgi:hypothetical protein